MSDFTEGIVCGHCGTRVLMEIVAQYEVTSEGWDEGYGRFFSVDAIYQTCRCTACDRITLRYLEGAECRYLYPASYQVVGDLPDSVQFAYDEAQRVKAASANAYAVMLGRLLETICDDRGANGDDLYSKLKDLADKGEIPGKLSVIAHRLRELRNVGAHAGKGNLLPDTIPVLDNLSRALLDYLFAVPNYLNVAEQQLDRIKQSRKSK